MNKYVGKRYIKERAISFLISKFGKAGIDAPVLAKISGIKLTTIQKIIWYQKDPTLEQYLIMNFILDILIETKEEQYGYQKRRTAKEKGKGN